MQQPTGGGPLAAGVTMSAAELLAKLAREAGEPGLAAQAESLRERAAPLVDAAASAYEAAIGSSGDDYEVGRAYAHAAEPPLRIVEAAADVAALAACVAQQGDPARRADAVAAGLLAAGAARAAAELVAINLTMSAGDERARRAASLADDAARAAETARTAQE